MKLSCILTEDDIKQILKNHILSAIQSDSTVDVSVDLKLTPKYDYYDTVIGHTVSADVVTEVTSDISLQLNKVRTFSSVG